MVLELFRPFVIRGLLARELAYNIRGAGRLIEDEAPEVWPILEEAIQNKHVLLNRAPTLPRQQCRLRRRRDGGARAAFRSRTNGGCADHVVQQEHLEARERRRRRGL